MSMTALLPIHDHFETGASFYGAVHFGVAVRNYSLCMREEMVACNCT